MSDSVVPAHRVALRLALAGLLGGACVTLVVGLVLGWRAVGSVWGVTRWQDVVFPAVYFAQLSMGTEAAAEVLRRYGWRLGPTLAIPALVGLLLVAPLCASWFEAVALGHGPSGGLAAVMQLLDQGLHPEALLLVLLGFGPASVTLALQRAARRRLPVLLTITALVALTSGVAVALRESWSDAAERVLFLAMWPVGAALGLALMDVVEPGLAAVIRRAWLASRGEGPA